VVDQRLLGHPLLLPVRDLLGSPVDDDRPVFIECMNAERARTRPSSRVATTHTSSPSLMVRRVRLAFEPWM